MEILQNVFQLMISCLKFGAKMLKSVSQILPWKKIILIDSSEWIGLQQLTTVADFFENPFLYKRVWHYCFQFM